MAPPKKPADKDLKDYELGDPEAFMKNMAKVADQTATFMSGLLDDRTKQDGKKPPASPLEAFAPIAKALFSVAEPYLTDPRKMFDAQFDLWQRQMDVWQNTWQRHSGNGNADDAPAITPEPGDRRFKDSDWEDNPFFDLLKQSYLVTAKWAEDMVHQADGVDDDTRLRGNFYVRQLSNALSPSNFALTNPEVLKATLSSNGENLVSGMEHLLADYNQETGEFKISQTDLDAFEVGKNLALTPGKVVFQNKLFQLIQYAPASETVCQTPLLIVPPWINKFYILDLAAKKSFIKWVVEQGLTVFVVSWIDPDKKLSEMRFEDYMVTGILEAVGAVCKATGETEINAIGYCIGGTLLSATLAYMTETDDHRIKSATFFASQIDFENAGDLKVFIDEEQISALEKKMEETGYLDGRSMASTFNMLRSNDLIWSYVVNNYLLGKEPFPFDLLYWNSDSTRMPAAMHSFYLRECYLENHLAQNKMKLAGKTLDLSTVTLPTYNLAAREDHIAPLASAFKIGKLLGGDCRLVVAGSGHIAGVINPPGANKYQFWTNDKDAETPEAWLETAEEHPGSWWPDWIAWISQYGGDQVPARTPGDGKLKPIEDAPGSYVLKRPATPPTQQKD